MTKKTTKKKASTKKKPAKRVAAKAAEQQTETPSAEPATKPGRRSGGANISQIVREFPDGTPAKEIVAELASRGLTVKENYVYTIRSNAKRKAAGADGSAPGAAPPKSIRVKLGLDPEPTPAGGWRPHKTTTRVSLDDIIQQFVQDLRVAMVEQVKASIG